MYLFIRVTRQDGSLYSGTIGDSLIRVDTLVGGLATKVVRDELLNLGDASRSSHQDNLLDLLLLHVGIFHGLQCSIHHVRHEWQLDQKQIEYSLTSHDCGLMNMQFEGGMQLTLLA